jgi:hypothetical protein
MARQAITISGRLAKNYSDERSLGFGCCIKLYFAVKVDVLAFKNGLKF